MPHCTARRLKAAPRLPKHQAPPPCLMHAAGSMNHAVAASPLIDVDALRVGMFVHLDGGWLSHPFALSNFRIASPDQLSRIRGLGLQRVRWNPALSDAAAEPPPAPPVPAATPVVRAVADAAGARRAALAGQRERLRVCEQQFAEAAHESKQIFDAAEAEPQVAAARAEALAGALVDKMIGEPELCIRLLGNAGGDKASAHAVNVGVVSLLMGRALGLDSTELRELGIGALLHDIGKYSLPARLRQRDELRGHEAHVARGVLQARRMGLGDAATMVIAQHHEHADGSGFPLRIGGERMSVGSRIVALVNRYDELCNPGPAAHACTPHEAVALLFAQGQNRFDGALLGTFIRMIGVYPPGSTVQLTDTRFALVVGINSSRPLKPRVLVHEPGVPRDEALILDLERQPGLGVLRSIKTAALPQASFEYLAPRPRISWFFEPTALAA